MSCEFCTREIFYCTYISCVNCSDLPICVACYCLGKERTGHKKTHKYRVVDALRFPLFIGDWTAKEERLLLEGVLKFGFGNWGSISDYLRKFKDPRQCELHFRQVYLSETEVPVVSERDANGFIVQLPCDNPPPMPMDIEDATPSVMPEVTEKHPLMEFAGYMPLRKDFEVEYENDIEMYLADLEFYEDDREEDRAIKFRQLDIYNKVLDEREERKAFVMDRWLQELKNEKQFKGNVIQRNIYHTMKPYARFLSPEKHLALCQALVKEYILRMKLVELTEARRQGLTTEAEFKQFLQERRSNNLAKQKEYDVLLKEEFETKAAETQWRELLSHPDAEGPEAEVVLQQVIQQGSLQTVKAKIRENVKHLGATTHDAEPAQLDVIDFAFDSQAFSNKQT